MLPDREILKLLFEWLWKNKHTQKETMKCQNSKNASVENLTEKGEKGNWKPDLWASGISLVKRLTMSPNVTAHKILSIKLKNSRLVNHGNVAHIALGKVFSLPGSLFSSVEEYSTDHTLDVCWEILMRIHVKHQCSRYSPFNKCYCPSLTF